MDKVKIELNRITEKEISYNGVIIKIKNFIDIETYEIVLADIMKNIILNAEIDNKISNIKIRFAKDILELLTNIDVSDFVADDYFSSDIIEVLTLNINNYSECLGNVLKEYDVYQNKVGFGFIASKVPSEDGIKDIINNISNMVQNMDSNKLETILKGVAFDKMPLANFILNSKKKNKE